MDVSYCYWLYIFCFYSDGHELGQSSKQRPLIGSCSWNCFRKEISFDWWRHCPWKQQHPHCRLHSSKSRYVHKFQIFIGNTDELLRKKDRKKKGATDRDNREFHVVIRWHKSEMGKRWHVYCSISILYKTSVWQHGSCSHLAMAGKPSLINQMY